MQRTTMEHKVITATAKGIDVPARGVLHVLLIAIAFNTVLSSHAEAGEGKSPVLKGAYIEFPPLSYTTNQGTPAGRHLNAANRLARAAGYEIEWRGLPIDRIYLYLREGRLDLWLGSKGVPTLAEWTLEPAFSLPPVHLNAYHMRGTQPVSDITDLKGKHLILIRGYTYRERLEPATQAETTQVDHASTHRAGLRMLKAGRGDYLLDFEAPVTQTLQEVSVPGITPSPLTQWGTTLVFSRKTRAVRAIVRDFEQTWSQKAHSLTR
ncbi:substrate-binding periplasmic protein [Halomonadaceae bacterium KBTZ08]